MDANVSMKDHWNRVYDSNETTRLGWYEAVPEKSLQLISQCDIQKDDPILDIGSGASTLIDALVEKGFRNIIAADLSEVALDKLKGRLGRKKASRVSWIVDDVTQSVHLSKLSDVALWHDRAVLHFLVEEKQRQAYRATLDKALRQGGYVIIAAFSLEGANKCSGLDVHNYDAEMLSHFLGEGYKLKASFDFTYRMPSGASRPYIYTLFERLA